MLIVKHKKKHDISFMKELQLVKKNATFGRKLTIDVSWGVC